MSFWANIRLSRRFLMAVLCLSTALCYWPLLKAPFKTIDDATSIINNTDLRQIQNLPKFFKTSFFNDGTYYRPLVHVLFMLQYQLFGLQASGYYGVTILLHLLTAAAVFFLMERLLKERWIAFGTAFLFAVHPIQWEAVTHISGQAILLCGLFSVLTFYFFLLALEGEKKYHAFFSWICFAGAVLSKEAGVVLPVLMLWYSLIFYRQEKKYWKNFLWCWLPVVFLTLGYFYVRQHLDITRIVFWATPTQMALAFLTFLRGTLIWARLILFPVGFHFDRGLNVLPGFFNADTALVALFYGMLFWLGFKIKIWRRPLVLFLVLWCVCQLLPVSHLIPVAVQPGYLSVAEHFLYLASVGIFALLMLGLRKLEAVAFFHRWITFSGVRLAIVGGSLFLMLMTFRQAFVSASPLVMYKEAVVVEPQNMRLQHALGLAYAFGKSYRQAEQHFRLALMQDPTHTRLRICLGQALADQGYYLAALNEYEKVNNPVGYEDVLRENFQEASRRLIAQYEEGTLPISEKQEVPILFGLAVAYSRLGDVAKSIAHFEKVIALNPKHKDALFNLGSILEAMRDDVKAQGYFEAVVKLEPFSDYLTQVSYAHLGDIYKRAGHLSEAEAMWQKASAIQAQIFKSKIQGRNLKP